LYSVDEERKAMHGFEFHSTGKNSMKMVKEATKSNQQGIYPSKDRCQG
jgi:hypothetical protein